MGIPHIYHTPFYVYAYAFGQLLVLALYQQFKAEGESSSRSMKIFSAGGSEAPVKVLSEAGINIRDPKFWQGGFNVLEKLVSELEKLPVDAKPKAKTKTSLKKKTVKAKPGKKKSSKKKK